MDRVILRLTAYITQTSEAFKASEVWGKYYLPR